jgi:hypothetical protein
MDTLDEYLKEKEEPKALNRNKHEKQQAREAARLAQLPSTSGVKDIGHVTVGEFTVLWVNSRYCECIHIVVGVTVGELMLLWASSR